MSSSGRRMDAAAGAFRGQEGREERDSGQVDVKQREAAERAEQRATAHSHRAPSKPLEQDKPPEEQKKKTARDEQQHGQHQRQRAATLRDWFRSSSCRQSCAIPVERHERQDVLPDH